MKRLLLGLLAILLIASGITYRVVDGCGDWQDRYKRVIYSDMNKSSPIILTPERIEEIVGEPPLGCTRPASRLSEKDIDRLRREAGASKV